MRFATLNASLDRAAAGRLVTDLSTPDNAQAREVAEVIQRNRPDVLLVNEFGYVPDNAAADLFRANHLERGQHGAEPIDDPCALVAPSDTGDDAHGFGAFEGQFGMLVLSKYPIDTRHLRTFQTFRWADMPGVMLPDDPATPAPPRLVVAGDPGRAAAVVEVALGPARAHRPLDGRLHVSHPTRGTAAGAS